MFFFFVEFVISYNRDDRFLVPSRHCTKVCVANKSVCSQDELSNDIETLLEEIRDVQTRLADLPDESLDTMAEGLKVSLTVYKPLIKNNRPEFLLT